MVKKPRRFHKCSHEGIWKDLKKAIAGLVPVLCEGTLKDPCLRTEVTFPQTTTTLYYILIHNMFYIICDIYVLIWHLHVFILEENTIAFYFTCQKLFLSVNVNFTVFFFSQMKTCQFKGKEFSSLISACPECRRHRVQISASGKKKKKKRSGSELGISIWSPWPTTRLNATQLRLWILHY